MRISVRQIERFLVSTCVFLMVVLFCNLFLRGCGGPFPERVRGPFAKDRYTRLGDLPQEELELAKDVEIPPD